MFGRYLPDFLAGCVKVLTILSPLLLLVLVIWTGGSNCTGDCGVGMAMLVVFMLPAIGLFVLVVILPLVIFLVARWTRDRPTQRFGAIAFVPLVVGALVAVRIVLGIQAVAGVKPEYLSRAIEHPVGKVEHLLWAGRGGSCGAECYAVLINGMADSFSYATVATEAGGQVSIESINRLGALADCKGQTYTARSSVRYLQSQGIFDACVIDVPAGEVDAALLIGGDNQDRFRVTRRNGPLNVAVAQQIGDGVLGPELVRWEYGTLPYSGTRVGDAFQMIDFVRALTGIRSDRLAELNELTLRQRLARVHRELGNATLDLYSVFNFLRAAPDSWEFPTGNAILSPQEAAQIKELGEKICSASPKVHPYDGSDKEIECDRAYAELVGDLFPKVATGLEPTSPPSP
jgi:hypothetical protein